MNRVIITAVIKTARLPFLFLTLVCVALAFSLAEINQAGIDTVSALVIMITALSAHITINILNEYMDFKSGLDFETVKTPFSGGSGALPEYPEAAIWVLSTAIFTVLITLFTGLWLVMQTGVELLIAGLAGLILIVSYTPWINRHPLICLIAPGMGFGPIMLGGSFYVLAGEVTTSLIFSSLVVFFLVNNLLVLNQFPDIDADRKVGRKNIIISHGINKSIFIYSLFSLAAGMAIVMAVYQQVFPHLSSWSLGPWLLTVIPVYGMIKHRNQIGEHKIYLATNVLITLLVPLVLALSFILS